jgi:hypothetical protein
MSSLFRETIAGGDNRNAEREIGLLFKPRRQIPLVVRCAATSLTRRSTPSCYWRFLRFCPRCRFPARRSLQASPSAPHAPSNRPPRWFRTNTNRSGGRFGLTLRRSRQSLEAILGSQFRNVCTNGVDGRLRNSAGAPTCSILPPLRIATRSATSIASAWSCVTKTVVRPVLS